MLLNRRRYLWLIIALLLSFSLSFWIRIDEYFTLWKKQPSSFFISPERPVFTGMDSFFFAKRALAYEKAMETGKFRWIRAIKGYSVGLPIITAFFSKTTGKPPEMVSVWLSPLLASLATVVALLYGLEMGSLLIGFVASITVGTSFIYVVRSKLCWLDTDILNLFFPLILSYLILLFAQKNLLGKIISLILLYICSDLWVWWYGHRQLVYLWLSTAAFVALILLFKYAREVIRNKNTKALINSAICLMIIFSAMAWGIGHKRYITHITKYYEYMTKYLSQRGSLESQKSPVPNPPVKELQKANLSKIAEMTVGNEVIFALAILGLLFTLIKHPLKLIPLIPLIALGGASIKAGIRFSMFLTPVVGIGLGVFLRTLKELLMSKVSKLNRSYTPAIYVVMCFLIVLFSNRKSLSFVSRPIISPGSAKAMVKVKSLTPKQARILAWWDIGYPIQYYSNRRTFTDGGNQNRYLIYLTALTFTSTDPEDAYGFISIATNGRALRRFLSQLKKTESIEISLGSVGKVKPRVPVFVLFTDYYLHLIPLIYKMGTWDPKSKRPSPPTIIPTPGCHRSGAYIRCEDLYINLKNFTARTKYGSFPIKEIISSDGRFIIKRSTPNPYGLNWVLAKGNGLTYGYLADDMALNSMLFKMYFLRAPSIGPFKLVFDNFPWGVLYKVSM